MTGSLVIGIAAEPVSSQHSNHISGRLSSYPTIALLIGLASSLQLCTLNVVDVFRSVLSSQPHVNQLHNRTLFIIDRPKVTLKQPFVNQAFVREWTETIATCESEPGSRTNPLYATVAGMGKGKTRFFVELEKTLNEREDVFAVAITFNSDFSAVKKFDEEDDEVSMAVEVVLRMLTMAYSVADFKALRTDFTEALRSLRRHQKIDEVKLLRECAKFLVDDVRSSGRPCAKFVLLIDEPRKLVESGISVNAFNQLRRAVLDGEMEEMGFRVSMAMTALDITITGATDSGRPIVTMPLPTELSIDDMYTQWLLAHLPQLSNASQVDNSTKPSLKALLSLTAPIPRTTELLVKVLQDVFPTNKSVSFTMETTAKVLTKLMERVKSRYFGADKGAKVVLENTDLVFHVLWRKDTQWNDDVNRAMIDGFLVNPPERVSNNTHFIPAIAALSLCRLSTYLTDEMTLFKPVVEATMKIACNAAAYHETHTLGRPLELMGNAFLTCKVLSAERVNRGVYSLYKLLGIKDNEMNYANTRLPDMIVHRRQELLMTYYHPTPLPCSYDNISNHLAALRQCQLDDRDVLVVKGHDDEGWDGLWLLRQKNGKPFVLAVDYKFRELLGDKPTATTSGRRRASNRQAERFRDRIVAACKEAFPSTSGYDESAAAAIAAGDYRFVYVDTAPSDEAEGDVSRVFADDAHFIRLTGAAARNVMTDAGWQVLDIVRRSSARHQQSQRPQP